MKSTFLRQDATDLGKYETAEIAFCKTQDERRQNGVVEANRRREQVTDESLVLTRKSKCGGRGEDAANQSRW